MAKMAKDHLPRVGQSKNKQSLYLEKIILSAARTGDSQKLCNALQRVDLNEVNLNLKENDEENTPLMIAAEHGHEKIVSILLSCGCDVTLRNATGQTVIDIAPERIKRLILDAVNRRGAGHPLLWQAAWQGNATVVNKLLNLNHNLNINSKNSEGFTPLLLVTRDLNLFDKIQHEVFSKNYNPTEVVAQLLHQNADCTVVDCEGRNSLHLTASHRGSNAKNIINILTRKDSLEVDVRDNKDRSALHFASDTGDPSIMLALIDNGADINARGHLGRTPLHITASNGDEWTSGLLVDHGANVLLVDDLGFTPVDVAKGDNVQILLKEAWTEHVDRSMNLMRITSAPNALPIVKLEHLDIQENDAEEQKFSKKTSRKSLKKLRGRSHSEEQSTTPPMSNNLPRRARSKSSGSTTRHILDPVKDINPSQCGRRGALVLQKSCPGYVKDSHLDSSLRQTKTLSRLVPSEAVFRTTAKVTVLNIDCKLPQHTSKSCSELPLSRYRAQKPLNQRTNTESLDQPFDDVLSLQGRSLSVLALSSFETLPQITPEVPERRETNEWVNDLCQAPLHESLSLITSPVDDTPTKVTENNDAIEADGDVLNRTFNSKDKPVFWFPLVKDIEKTSDTDESFNQAFFVNLGNLETPVALCAKCGGNLYSGDLKPAHGNLCFSCHQESVGKNSFWVSLDGRDPDVDEEMAERSFGFDDKTILIDEKMLSCSPRDKSNDARDTEEHGVKSSKEEGEIHGRKERLDSDMTNVVSSCGKKIETTVIRSDAESDTLNVEDDVRHEGLGDHSSKQLKKCDVKEKKTRESSVCEGPQEYQEQRELKGGEEPKGEGFEEPKEQKLFEKQIFERTVKHSEHEDLKEPQGSEESKKEPGYGESWEQQGYRGMEKQQGFEDTKELEDSNEHLRYEELKEQWVYNELEEKQEYVEPDEQQGYKEPQSRHRYEETQEPDNRLGIYVDQKDQVKTTYFGTRSHSNADVRRDSEIIPHEVVIVNPFPTPEPPEVPVVNIRSNCHCDRLATFANEARTGSKRKAKGKAKKSVTSNQKSVAKTGKGSAKNEGDSLKCEEKSLKKKSVVKRKKKGKGTERETLKEISVVQPKLKGNSCDEEQQVKSAAKDNPAERLQDPDSNEAVGQSLPLLRTTALKGKFAVLSPIPESSRADSVVVDVVGATMKTEGVYEENQTDRDNIAVPRLSEIVLAQLVLTVDPNPGKSEARATGEAHVIATDRGGMGEVQIPSNWVDMVSSDDSEFFGTVSEMDAELEDIIQEILEETEKLDKKEERHGKDYDSAKSRTDVDRNTNLKNTNLKNTNLKNTNEKSAVAQHPGANFSLKNDTNPSCTLGARETVSTNPSSRSVTTGRITRASVIADTICETSTGMDTSTRNAENTNARENATHASVNTNARAQMNQGTCGGVNTDSISATMANNSEKSHQPNQSYSENVFDNVSSWLLGSHFRTEPRRFTTTITSATDSPYGTRGKTPVARMADVSSDYSSLSDDTWEEMYGRGEHVIEKGLETSQQTSSARWPTSSVTISISDDGSGNGRNFVGDSRAYVGDGRAYVGDCRTSEEIPREQRAASGGLVHSRISRRKFEHSQTPCSETTSNEEEEIVWKKGNVLGKGAFGTVWCGLTNTGQMIAVKQVELITSNMEVAERQYEKLQEEVALLKSLRHVNIVSYLGTCLDGGVVNIFMQFVPGGSIASILARFGPLEETVFRYYTGQIVVGVEYLHRNNVVHRDIKGGNIMLMPTGVIKLIDFGCAKRLYMNMSHSQEDLLHSMKGTPYWMAPEVITETGYGRKSDVWSIGCTVFEMATGKPPWSHLPPMSAILAIGQGTDPPTLGKPNSPDACNFVTCSMTRNPDTRWSAEELLQHPFIKKYDEQRKMLIDLATKTQHS